jgi:MinD superfamily P-loop ATPase
VLIVAEPSLSGISDMKRILKTAAILGTRAAVCVNKADVSPENTEAIRVLCGEHGIPFVGTVPFDPAVADAVNEGRSVADVPSPGREALTGGV